jgi:hypothetical protein
MIKILHTVGNKQCGKRTFTRNLLEKYFYVPDLLTVVNSTKRSPIFSCTCSVLPIPHKEIKHNFLGCSVFTNAIHEDV